MSLTVSRVRRAAAATVVATGLLFAGAQAAQAANPNPPKITSPTGNLTNEGRVTANLSGLDAGATYFVSICDGTGPTPPACNKDEVNEYMIRHTATGPTATVSLNVAREFETTDHGGQSGKKVSCKGSTGVQCYLVVTKHAFPYPTAGTAVTFND